MTTKWSIPPRPLLGSFMETSCDIVHLLLSEVSQQSGSIVVAETTRFTISSSSGATVQEQVFHLSLLFALHFPYGSID
jgi:hypothetical protein